jgi:hypothetical protein
MNLLKRLGVVERRLKIGGKPRLPFPIITNKEDGRAWAKGIEYPTLKAAKAAHPGADSVVYCKTVKQAKVLRDLLTEKKPEEVAA